uniref:Uncharacterized protein MANES_03G178600 n=1 Tax=Rhizophora mucronata TaxID=61149 RepID=A0A2P2QRF9_RHIMU
MQTRRRKVLVIGRESEIGSDAAVGKDDGAAVQHVEVVGGRLERWRPRFRKVDGKRGCRHWFYCGGTGLRRQGDYIGFGRRV